MADSSSPPANMPKKKKKALAFLNGPSPKAKPADPSSDGIGNTEEQDADDDLAMFKRSKHFFPIVVEEQDKSRHATPEKKAAQRSDDLDDEKSGTLDREQTHSRPPKRRRLSTPRVDPEVPAFESHDELYGPATPPRPISQPSQSVGSESRFKRARSSLDEDLEKAGVSASEKAKMDEDNELDPFGPTEPQALPTPKSPMRHPPSFNTSVTENDADFSFDDPPAFSEGDGGDNIFSNEPAQGKSANEGADSATPAAADPQPKGQASTNADAIVLDDSDDDDDVLRSAATPAEDPYAHFVKRAAEREAAAKAAAAALIPSNEGHDESRDDDPSWSAPKVNPVIKIFVVSRLSDKEDPGHFGSKRRLDQDLGLVRKTYCTWLRQRGFPVSQDMQRDIFFTWKGRRIYDSASGASLGWQPDSFHEFRNQTGFRNGGILLEAWTDERYTADVQEQERQRLLDRGELDEDELDADADNERDAPKVRITLKERGKDPVKLTAWLDLHVKHLIGAYRRQQNVPANQHIRLRNEGEWLEPDSLIEDADIEDMSIIEVYLGPDGA